MLHNVCEADVTALDKIINISSAAGLGMPLAQLQYIGDKDYGNFAVVGTTLTLFADDTDGATTTVLVADTNAAGYDTFGELVDAVRATGVFRMILHGCLRAQDSDAMFVPIANTTCKTTNGITLLADAGTASQVQGYAITNEKFVSRPSTGNFSTEGWTRDRNCINSIKYQALTIGNGAGTMTYSYRKDGYDNNFDDAEGTIFTEAFADDTAETHGATDPADIWLSAPKGCALVVTFAITTGANDFDNIAHNVIGHTKDVLGGQVPSDNWTGCV